LAAGPNSTVRQWQCGRSFLRDDEPIDSRSDDDDFSTTNQQDFTWSRVVGGGLYIPVSTDRNGDHLSIDIGFQRFMTGHANYLRPGSIQDLPSGTVITPLESDTHMLLVHVGVRFGR